MFSDKLWKCLIIDYIIITISVFSTLLVIINFYEYRIIDIINTTLFSGILIFIILTIIEIILYYIEM